MAEFIIPYSWQKQGHYLRVSIATSISASSPVTITIAIPISVPIPVPVVVTTAIPSTLRPCSAGYGFHPLFAGDQLSLKEIRRSHDDSLHILPVALPLPARRRPIARDQLGDAATGGVDDCPGRSVWAVV